MMNDERISHLYVRVSGGNSIEKLAEENPSRRYVILYASITPFGSAGASHIMRAVVVDTSGKLTLLGAPGTTQRK